MTAHSRSSAPARAPEATPGLDAPAPSVASPGSPDWAASMQGTLGNQALQEQLAGSPQPEAPGRSAQDQLPADVELRSAGVSFRLPGNTALTGDWNQLQTTRGTQVWMTVTRSELRVTFSPALEVDAQFPLSNVAWSGFTYDFTRGQVAHVGAENTQFAIPIAGTVREAVTDFVMRLVRGTPLGRAGYDPLADRDVAGTLRAVQGNFTAGGGGGARGDLRPSQVTDVAFNASVRTRQAVQAGTSQGGLSLPAGASIDVSVGVEGNGETLARGGVPAVRQIHLSSSDLVLSKDGEPIVRLRSLRMDRGGAVDVLDFEPLGKLRDVGAGESLIRLFAALIALEAGDPRLAANSSLEPRVVNGVAERELERSLTAAVQDLVRAHHDVVPGVDLRSVLGVEPARGAGTRS